MWSVPNSHAWCRARACTTRPTAKPQLVSSATRATVPGVRLFICALPCSKAFYISTAQVWTPLKILPGFVFPLTKIPFTHWFSFISVYELSKKKPKKKRILFGGSFQYHCSFPIYIFLEPWDQEIILPVSRLCQSTHIKKDKLYNVSTVTQRMCISFCIIKCFPQGQTNGLCTPHWFLTTQFW